MNQKVAIWKRKLAKEKWKNQKAVWEKISNPTPTARHIDIEANSNDALNDLLRQATKTLDTPIRQAVLDHMIKVIKGFQ